MFWVFVLICLMLLWAVVQKTSHPPVVQDDTTAAPLQTVEPANKPSVAQALLVNVGPFVLLAAVWVFLLVRLGPMRLRRIYRKDPVAQGQFTVNVAPDSIQIRNTSGTSSQTGWNIYVSWREKDGIIVLVLHSSACFAMSLAGLSEMQRGELRGILSAALPNK